MYSSTGALIAKYNYDVWGNVLSVTNATGAEITSSTHIALLQSFRYRSYYLDKESNFYYLQSRYYDPVTHRFINADDINLILSSPATLTDKNLYAYCDNNPVTREDSNGALWFVKAGLGALKRYVKDIVGNVKSGKTGWNIIKPTSSLGAYISSAVAEMIPGYGFGTSLIRNTISEGILVGEKLIKGKDVNVSESLKKVAKDTVIDYGTGLISSKVTDYISSKAPKNYSSYANSARKTNPNLTREQIRNSMRHDLKNIRIANGMLSAVFNLTNERLKK